MLYIPHCFGAFATTGLPDFVSTILLGSLSLVVITSVVGYIPALTTLFTDEIVIYSFIE